MFYPTPMDQLRNALELIKQGEELEKQGNIPDAIELMKNGYEQLFAYYKASKDQNVKNELKKKITGILDHIEQLKAPKQQKEEKQQDSKNQYIDNIIKQMICPNLPKLIDFVGMEDQKRSMQELVVIPKLFPHLFQNQYRHRSFLLYGPPGCGKTQLVRCVAGEINATLFRVMPTDIYSRYNNDSEKIIKQLFETAKQYNPAIIFFDDVEQLFDSSSESESYRRWKTEFFVQLSDIKDQNLIIIGATNDPMNLDYQMRRRLNYRIEIPLPNESSRVALMKKNLEKVEQTISDEEFVQVSKLLDGYTPSDIIIVLREAMIQPVRQLQKATHFINISEDKITVSTENEPGSFKATWDQLPSEKIYIPPLTFLQLVDSVEKVKKCVNERDLERYKQFREQFGTQ